MKFQISNFKSAALRVGLPLLLIALALLPVRGQRPEPFGPRTTPGGASPFGGLPPFGGGGGQRRRAPEPTESRPMGRAGLSEPTGEFTFTRMVSATANCRFARTAKRQRPCWNRARKFSPL